MNTIIVQADNKISKALITIFNALNVTFEVKKEKKKEENPYNPEFVKMVLESKKSKVRIPYNEDYKKKIFQGI